MRMILKRRAVYSLLPDKSWEFSHIDESSIGPRDYETIYWLYSQLCQQADVKTLTYRTILAQLKGERTLKELPAKALEIFCSENGFEEIRRLSIQLPIGKERMLID
ncbi:MAG: hypothetical protein RSA98_10080 [Odoribacter sp.]